LQEKNKAVCLATTRVKGILQQFIIALLCILEDLQDYKMVKINAVKGGDIPIVRL